MSEPVKNTDVEDVLSSIKRLVSEEHRPVQAAPKSTTSDRLVLTPALRVADDAAQTSQEATASLGADVPTQMSEDLLERHENAASHDSILAALSAQRAQAEIARAEFATPFVDADRDGASDEEQGPYEFGTDGAWPEPQYAWDKEPAEDVEAEENTAEDASAQSTATLNEDGEIQPVPPETAGGALTETVALVDEAAQEDEADTAVDGTEDLVEGVTSVDVEGGAEDTDAAKAEPEHSVEHSVDHTGPEAPKTPTLTDKIAALEAVIGKTDDQWEPDDTGDSDYSGTKEPAMAWEDTEAVSDQDVLQDDDALVSPEDILDEEALRDLVSEIVRQELQGALGERITRNVRKLVRREIHRALAAQELE